MSSVCCGIDRSWRSQERSADGGTPCHEQLRPVAPFIADGVWDATPLETELLNQADRLVGGSDAVLVIDDTSLPKKGERSVVALKTFGNEGFKAATIRQIADEAGVNLPAIKYYFDGKEGLYLACAHEIAARYGRLMLPIGATAREALALQMDTESARTHLKHVFGALADFLLGTSEVHLWTLFVQRDGRSGPRFRDFVHRALETRSGAFRCLDQSRSRTAYDDRRGAHSRPSAAGCVRPIKFRFSLSAPVHVIASR